MSEGISQARFKPTWLLPSPSLFACKFLNMDSVYPEVSEALSLIESIELPHSSGALLSFFVTQALDQCYAAKFVLARCGDGNSNNRQAHLIALIDDWTYIVESSKFLDPGC